MIEPLPPLFGLIAAAFYVAFIVMSVIRAKS